MKRKYYNQMVESLNKAGIYYNGEKCIYIDDAIKVEKFLLSFSSYNYVLGFDLFNGACSGNASIILSNNSTVSFAAKDCGTDRFTFVVKSLILFLGDKNDNICPTLIFESEDIYANYITMKNNIRYESYYGGYNFIKKLYTLNEADYKEVVIDNEEVDELLYQRHNGEEEVPDFYTEEIYLDRKIFACLNIQGDYNMNFPFSFSRFLLHFANQPAQVAFSFLKNNFK